MSTTEESRQPKPCTEIATLGPARRPSPLLLNTKPGDEVADFVPEEVRVRFDAEVGGGARGPELLFEKAGPRERIYFDPERTRVAIVTCGGLCPGLNNVIRSAVLELHHNYGVRDILGIRYGYQGLDPAAEQPPIPLDPDLVDDIHQQGGTMLGSSRGNPPVPAMLDTLERLGVHILLAVGGDGTQKGALALDREARRRGLQLAIVGVPKTIDNDILYVARTFGFATAIDRARDVLKAAHAEARGYFHGIALVRLMGRDSGFIAAGATLASQEVNFTLIPELPFRLEGEHGFLAVLKERILTRRHALIVVAEGAGQDLLESCEPQRDASGNVIRRDIGPFLRDRITAFFQAQKIAVSMKYIDPSYYIRSVPADSEDSVLSDMYARNAVHAAMAGKTRCIIGMRHGFMHVPLEMATDRRQRVPLEGALWRSVLAATGQPPQFR